MIVEATDQTFEALRQDGIVVIGWWAPWSASAREFAPVFAQAAASHPGIVFANIDIDTEPALAARFDVHTVPTLTAYRDGLWVFHQAGARSAGALDRLIAQIRALDIRARLSAAG